MSKQQPDALVLSESQQFPAKFRSVHLATCNAAGEPEASYAAYVERDGHYYVYVSELAAHTTNLRETGRCAALFIESEADAQHLFARKRLTLKCTATETPRGSAEFNTILDAFEAKFGHFMAMMRKLADFHLFKLTAEHGNYVAGFAKAYALDGAGLSDIRLRNDQGHRPEDRRTQTELDAAIE